MTRTHLQPHSCDDMWSDALLLCQQQKHLEAIIASFATAMKHSKQLPYPLSTAHQALFAALEFINNPDTHAQPCKPLSTPTLAQGIQTEDLTYQIQFTSLLVQAIQSESPEARHLLTLCAQQGPIGLQIAACVWLQSMSSLTPELQKHFGTIKSRQAKKVALYTDFIEGIKAFKGWYRKTNIPEGIKTFENIAKTEEPHNIVHAACAYLLCAAGHCQLALTATNYVTQSERIARTLQIHQIIIKILFSLASFPRKELHQQLFQLSDIAINEKDKISLVHMLLEHYQTEVLLAVPNEAILKDVFAALVKHACFFQQLDIFKKLIETLNSSHKIANLNIGELILLQLFELIKIANTSPQPKLQYFVYKAYAECCSRYQDKNHLYTAIQAFEAVKQLAPAAEEKFDLISYRDIYKSYAAVTKDTVAYSKAADLGDIDSTLQIAQIATEDGMQVDLALRSFNKAMHDAVNANDVENILTTLKQTLEFKRKSDLSAVYTASIEKIILAAYQKLNDAVFIEKNNPFVFALHDIAQKDLLPHLAPAVAQQAQQLAQKHINFIEYKQDTKHKRLNYFAQNNFLPAIYELFLTYTKPRLLRKAHARRPLYLCAKILLLTLNPDAASAQFRLPKEVIKGMMTQALAFFQPWETKKFHFGETSSEEFKHHKLALWYREVIRNAHHAQKTIDPDVFLLQALDIDQDSYNMPLIRTFVTADMKRTLKVQDDWIQQKHDQSFVLADTQATTTVSLSAPKNLLEQQPLISVTQAVSSTAVISKSLYPLIDGVAPFLSVEPIRKPKKIVPVTTETKKLSQEKTAQPKLVIETPKIVIPATPIPVIAAPAPTKNNKTKPKKVLVLA